VLSKYSLIHRCPIFRDDIVQGIDAVDRFLRDEVLGQFRTLIVGGKHPHEEHEDQDPDEEQGVEERPDKTRK
jgi:hypothetical protein